MNSLSNCWVLLIFLICAEMYVSAQSNCRSNYRRAGRNYGQILPAGSKAPVPEEGEDDQENVTAIEVEKSTTGHRLINFEETVTRAPVEVHQIEDKIAESPYDDERNRGRGKKLGHYKNGKIRKFPRGNGHKHDHGHGNFQGQGHSYY